MSSLAAMLDAVPPQTRALLDRFGFDRALFEQLAQRLEQEQIDNRVAGVVEPPAASDIMQLPTPGSAEHATLTAAGMDLLRKGQVALVVLAGGMATRMGGVVKALVPALGDATFLDLRLAEVKATSDRAGAPMPFWLMTSAATEDPTRQALGSRLDDDRVATFPQFVSLRLRSATELYLDDAGNPSVQAFGHGDLPDALKRSGLLDRFVDRGGRLLVVANLDNLGASVDPALLGLHASHGLPVSCEVVDKEGTDRGGIPVRWQGRPVVLEEFRLPEGFDPSQVRVFNTNTFVFDARAIRDLQAEWTYFVVKKQVAGSTVIQFERLLGEITSHLPSRFIHVPRKGAETRFLPVKDHAELEARQGELETVARARGML
ncbi:MAG: UTP--glucose-1-phosphate uridylyltransferase [Polyangiaceae bacterium]